MGERELKAGAIGLILMPIVAFFALVGPLIAFTVWYEMGTYNTRPFLQIFSSFGIITWILFLVSAILMMNSMIKANRTFEGGQVGTVGGIFALLTAILYISYHVFPLVGTGLEFYEIYELFDVLPTGLFGNMKIMGFILLGLAMILFGVFFLRYRGYFSNNGLWIATGVIFLIGGVFSITMLMAFVGYILLFIAGIVGAVSFLITDALEAYKEVE